MRRITITLAAALTTALTGLGALAAAPAEAADGTTIVSPTAGAEVPTGTHDVTVQFGATDAYEVDVEGPGNYYDWRDHNADAGETHTFTGFDAMTAAGSYEVTVYDGNNNLVASSDFTVVAPPVQVTKPAATPTTFYPVVRDGYKDRARMSYTLNRRATVTASVYRATDGKRVRRDDVATQGRGRHGWTWNGLTNAGNPVAAGKFRVEITAEDTDGNTATAKAIVTAVTSTVTRHDSKSVTGYRTSSTSHRGNCYANRSSYFGETNLDCWGGVYAQATYRFAVPNNAANLTWRVRGEVNCCDRGKIIRTGSRVSPSAYRVLVKVTNWRAFTVTGVSVSYSYRDRI